MRTLRLFCLPAALVALVVPATSAGASPGVGAPSTPTLVSVRAAHHADFDRVVFRFRGGLPAQHTATYVRRLLGDASGLPVPVAGRAILRVRFEPAAAHDAAGHATAPGRVAFALPNVMTAVRSGDFEAVTTYGLGLAARTRVSVSTLRHPARVIVDIRAAFPTTARRVWLFSPDRFVANTPPFFVPVVRPVRAPAATGLMDRLFAGPTAAERAAGLRLLASGATGARPPVVTAGVARVRLVGGCSSGGSTVSVAGEIMPTLRALPSVDFVKIYDPSGATETPTGRTDSIPACLEP